MSHIPFLRRLNLAVSVEHAADHPCQFSGSAAGHQPLWSRPFPEIWIVNTGITRSGAEFIALVALAMSLVAMSIDSMLPALGSIAADLGTRDPNDRQLVLAAFFAGLT